MICVGRIIQMMNWVYLLNDPLTIYLDWFCHLQIWTMWEMVGFLRLVTSSGYKLMHPKIFGVTFFVSESWMNALFSFSLDWGNFLLGIRFSTVGMLFDLFDDIVSEDMSLEDTSSGDRCLEDTGFERYEFQRYRFWRYGFGGYRFERCGFQR